MFWTISFGLAIVLFVISDVLFVKKICDCPLLFGISLAWLLFVILIWWFENSFLAGNSNYILEFVLCFISFVFSLLFASKEKLYIGGSGLVVSLTLMAIAFIDLFTCILQSKF